MSNIGQNKGVGEFSQKTSELALEVVSSLKDQAIPVFPENFESLFDQLANNDDSSFFKQILSERVDIHSETNERLLSFEIGVHMGLQHIKKILEVVQRIYKDLVVAHTISKKKTDEIMKINNPALFKNAIQLFFQDFENLQENMGSKIEEIHRVFEKIINDINRVQDHTIHDMHYGVYNKKYFMEVCQKEIETLKQIQQDSYLVALSLSRKFIEGLENKDEMKKSLKTMAKTLNKNLLSDDLLCYFGAGKFVILFKYFDLETIIQRVEVLLKIAKNTSFFFGAKEVSLELCAGIALIDYKKDFQVILNESLDQCMQAFSQEEEYQIFKE